MTPTTIGAKKTKEGVAERKAKSTEQRYDLEITFTDRLLGTQPKSKEVYARFIASKAPAPEDGEEEVACVDEVEERGWTGFAKDDTGIFLWDYQIRGFLKEQADALRQCGQHGVKGVKGKIDRFVFVRPRRIYIYDAKTGEPLQKPDGVVERPLRAETARGPRVSLARSDCVEPGRVVTCQIIVLWPDVFTEDLFRSILDRAQFIGLGQWRTGSNGLFGYQLEAK